MIYHLNKNMLDTMIQTRLSLLFKIVINRVVNQSKIKILKNVIWYKYDGIIHFK